jgi:hypothetical protein
MVLLLVIFLHLCKQLVFEWCYRNKLAICSLKVAIGIAVICMVIDTITMHGFQMIKQIHKTD